MRFVVFTFVAALAFALFAAAVLETAKRASRREPVAAAKYNELDQLVRFPKSEVACPPQTPRTLVAVLIGQSNASNTGGQRFRGPSNAVNFFAGKCFEAVDPLLGAADKQGSVWTLTAGLIADRYDHIVLVPLAVGGSTIAQWNTRFSPMLEKNLDSLQKTYTATHFLWHQGESDAHTTKPDDYVSGMKTLIETTRRRFPDSSFYVSLATFCELRGGADPALHRAQRSLADPARRVYSGPDSDRFIALEDRYDGCHFSPVAQEKVAREWAKLLR
jgi:hypothetical protein